MEHLPDNNSRYKDLDYWDERYKTEQCFDWLGSFSKFQHLLEKHVHKEDSILVLERGGEGLPRGASAAKVASLELAVHYVDLKRRRASPRRDERRGTSDFPLTLHTSVRRRQRQALSHAINRGDTRTTPRTDGALR
ncbi:Endothelin-converting enzyme 2 [Liparis tanakae]|uniref:Endothelin-converting enzyme 2 n=1 Tax=Liparis tanakae TaxID=230148 RepID=A0A4Z2HQC1_9TELE|nr:Endothelin-converting enzyme 2 [Liparis tanakae]